MLNELELTMVIMKCAVSQIQKDFHHIIIENVQISESVKIFINNMLVKQSMIILNIIKYHAASGLCAGTKACLNGNGGVLALSSLA